ncbi:hypothetical protein RhiirA5_302437, partial [Rhizophagus irregularis]
DVYNIDKQDDGTAFRIFHSQLLRMCQDNRIINLGKLGLFVYLFILGELFDAYLNREISHKTRIIMTMHAYFFLNFWKSYIEETSEKTSKECFISIQSYNIFKSLVESLILLIISHYDYYEDYPLLPWEHGTEALEHVFGIARQLIPDFTSYEFFKIL